MVSSSLALPRFPEAACRAPDVKPEWFFPELETAATTRAAREVCASCPELEDCQRYSIGCGPLLVGVWGGLSPLASGPGCAVAFGAYAPLPRWCSATSSSPRRRARALDGRRRDKCAVPAQAEAELASGGRCCECGGPIGPDRSPDALTCGRVCADRRGQRKRGERQSQKANPRPQLEARQPPDKAEASPDPLEVALRFFAGLPAAVTGLELAGGWRLERKVG